MNDEPISVFVRLVLPDGRVVDAVGTIEQAEMDHQTKNYFGYQDRDWILRFIPNELKIKGWRISEFDAAVNWETYGPQHIPAANQLLLGHARDSEEL